jgi:Common central domain of tyrosinase/von Willebrand factor type A domain
MRCRKNYRDLTQIEKDRLVAALYHLKSKGIVDQFANDHDTFFHAAHHSAHFLPWHREFLRRFEDALRTYDPTISIPYWNSTVDTSPSDPLWDNSFLGQFDSAWSLGRTLGAATLPTPNAVNTTLGIGTYDAFWPPLENSIHNPPHNWVGGVMATGASPGDPIFYLHHCWIDLLWAQWQLQHPGAPFVDSGAGAGLNDAMAPWTTTPADVLDHRTINLYHFPAGFQQDQSIATLDTPALTFNDIPEGETTVRAAVFSVSSCEDVHLTIVSGPTVVMGPAGTNFGTPLGTNVTVDPDIDPKGRIWISYTGTNNGDAATGTVTIRCTETNQDFVIPITANTIQRPTVAVVLALDKSNSMNFESGIPNKKRIDVLRFSAPPFVDLIQEGNAIGIVSFDQDAYSVMPVTGPLGPVGQFPDTTGRDTARVAIANHTPNPQGNTAIGDAVELAHTQLEPVTGYDIKATVVLTDGQETASQYIADVMDVINERVFAIGLGTVEQLNPVALTALTNGTGGYLQMTGPLDNNALFRVSKYYLQILAGVTNEDIVLDPEGWLTVDQVHRIPFRLNEADISSDVILLTPAPRDIRFTLETPSGQIIDPNTATANPAISYVTGENVSYYRMTLPVPIGGNEARDGIWHAVLSLEDIIIPVKVSQSTQVQTRGVRYSLNVHTYSNLRMRPSLSQNSHEPGAILTLRAVLTEYGLPVDSRATVHTELERPDKTATTLTLAEVEPGVFETIIMASMSGIYHFRVLASGRTLRGRSFTREQRLTGAVWKGGDKPLPTSKDDVTDCCRRTLPLLQLGIKLLIFLVIVIVILLIVIALR